MARIAHLARGLGALVVLAALVAGIPWALVHFVGWPLPHHVPTAAEIGHVLTSHGIGGRILIDALAVVVWITWAILVASVAAEIPAALAGRRSRLLPVAGVFQPLTGRLVAAIVVACLVLAPRPAHGSGAGSPAFDLAGVRRPVAALVLTGDQQRLTYAAPPTAPPAADTVAAGTTAPSTPGLEAKVNAARSYVVQHGDTLWGIAERELGDPLDWSKIYALNVGRPQPGGVSLTDPHWIDPGWTLLLPQSTTTPSVAVPPPVAVPSPAPSPPAVPPVKPSSSTSPVTATSPAEPAARPMPTSAGPTSQVPSSQVPSSQVPSSQVPSSAVPSSAVPTSQPATSDPTQSGHGSPPVQVNSTSPHPVDRGSGPVRLPSGSVVAGSFAAGVLSAVALRRLRRRHDYRYHPPEAGVDLDPPPLRPALRHLAWSAGDHAEESYAEDSHDEDRFDEDGSDEDSEVLVAGDEGNGTGPARIGAIATMAAGFVPAEAGGHLHAGLAEVGASDGHSVVIELTDLSGVAISGPAADDIARAMLAGLVVAAGPGAAEVLGATGLLERLLPGLGSAPAIRRAGTALEVARVVEAERIARTRRLDALGATDATSFREQHPENPLPALLVLADAPPAESAGRWAALCAGADRLAIVVIFLGDSPAATGRVVTDLARRVIEADPQQLDALLGGAELFGISAGEAVELLGPVFDVGDLVANTHVDSHHADDSTVAISAGQASHAARGAEALARAVAFDGAAQGPRSTPDAGHWPEPSTEPCTESSTAVEASLRPLRVEILGPPRVTVSGVVVSTGLRSRAKMLLAWYLCRPEGATAEQAVDALWPDTEPDGVLKQFWRCLGDLRAGLRGPGGETPEVLEKTGEHYRAKPGEISCDLWDFEVALGQAAKSPDSETARQALRQAVDAYRGDLLDGVEDPWVEPVREDLHRRALDAHLRLAELDEHAGRTDSAVATLERAVELDYYAEEPYRRLMVLYAHHGRTDAVTATWKLLRRRLAELDLDIDAATVNLYRSLSAIGAIDAPSVRLRS